MCVWNCESDRTRPLASKRWRKSTSGSVRVCDGSRARSKRSSSNAASGSIGCDLIVDEHAAARSSHARQLGDRRLGVRDVVQRPPRAGEVERAGLERQLGRVALDERDVRRCVAAGSLQQLGDDVDADDLADERRQRERERSRARAAVDRTLVPGRSDEPPKLLAHRLDLTRGVFGDELGGGTEPCTYVVDVRLSHRRQFAVRGEGPSRSRTSARS